MSIYKITWISAFVFCLASAFVGNFLARRRDWIYKNYRFEFRIPGMEYDSDDDMTHEAWKKYDAYTPYICFFSYCFWSLLAFCLVFVSSILSLVVTVSICIILIIVLIKYRIWERLHK